MDNFTDLIDEKHDIFLENLCRIRKIANIAETKDTDDFLSRQHRIDLSSTLHVFGNYHGASFAKADCEETPNLDQSLLQYLCLHVVGLLRLSGLDQLPPVVEFLFRELLILLILRCF